MPILTGIIVVAFVLAVLVAFRFAPRRTVDDIWEWSEHAYQPPQDKRRNEPRAVTRIRSNHIHWEIH